MSTVRVTIVTLSSFLLALSAGCGLDSPTTPVAPVQPPISTVCLQGPYTETITSSGGWIGDSDAWFDVPPSALSVSTELSMEVCTGVEPSATMLPHGQTFAVGCTLSIAKPASYDAEDTYHICLWNETTEVWDDLGGTDNGSYVSVTITHFSDYKLACLECE
jgi:hypothetical protein